MIQYNEVFDLEPSDLISKDEKSDVIYRDIKKHEFQMDKTSETIRMNYQTANVMDEGPKTLPLDTNGKQQDNELVAIRPTSKSTDELSEPSSANWKLHKVMVNAHQGWIRSCAVDPVTNQWFVTGSTDSTIKVWDLATSQTKAILTGHIMAVRSLVVSKKFPYLFSGSEDKTVRCWDLERSNSASGCQIRDYFGHVGGIYTMDLHPELDILCTAGRDAVVRVWDIRSRAEIMVLSGHRAEITSLNCHAYDPQIVTSSMDGTIRLWDIRKTSTQLTLTHHSKSIRSMVSHPQEMTMCSGDSSGNLKQWVLPKGELLNEFCTNESNKNKIINTLSINSVDNTLFAGYDDGRMEFYDYVKGELIQSTQAKPLPGNNESIIFASEFDGSGSRLITCESDKSIKIWSN